MGTLYVIGTPIGNLEDITLRAIRILGEVDLVLCEDTRITKRLLDRYDIPTRTMSYHEHTKSEKVDSIIKMLESGKNLALVSDAGTPSVSDPGSFLVSMIREKSSNKVNIVSVPGPSALTAALSVSSLPASDFVFFGFLPHKKGRMTLFKEIADTKRTSVMYESPHRVLKTLHSLKEVFEEQDEAPLRRITIARELTKIHEEVIEGTVDTLIGHFENEGVTIRGEFVILIQGKR
jgi:16S rRNA (cytidine1402-2'-O)-methyltransferase